MNKKLIISTVASIALVSSFNFMANMPSENTKVVQAAKTKKQRYSNKFYKVKVTKKTAYYKLSKNKKGAKVGYLKPGKVIFIRATGSKVGWKVGKNNKYCVMRSSKDYSWFTTNLKSKHTTTKVTTTTKVIEELPNTEVEAEENTSTTPSAPLLSTEEINFLKNPSVGNIEKFDKVLAMPTEKRHAAENILMEQMGLTQGNWSAVSYDQFEKQIMHISNSANSIKNTILGNNQ